MFFLKGIIKRLLFNCNTSHIYVFKRAWEASEFKFINNEGNQTSLLLAISDEEIKSESEIKDLILNSTGSSRYLINMECKRCGHRISIEDSLYLPKYSA